MDCLQQFSGWTDDKAEESLLGHVRMLKLRPLNEPGDVDSPLLRSQIDEHFLRAMAAQREQLRDVPNKGETSKKTKSHGHPPMYPRSAGSVNAVTAPGFSPPPLAPNSGHRRPRQPLPQQVWNNHGKPPVVYGDNVSVQSGISTESGFNHSYHDYGPSMGQYPPFYHGQVYGSSAATTYVDPYHAMNHSLHHHHHPGWYDPGLASYGVHPPAYFSEEHAHQVPKSPQEMGQSHTEKEEKEDHTSETTPHHIASASPQHYGHSPFWSHLVDGATQSLVTPAKVTPSTPVRSTHDSGDNSEMDESFGHVEHAEVGAGAQPLLLRGYHSYGYGHPYGSSDAYVPPSPATQFMMPPAQNNSVYYGYTAPSATFSPGRRSHFCVSPQKTEIPTPVRKVVEVVEAPSPATVETSTETSEALSHEAISA